MNSIRAAFRYPAVRAWRCTLGPSRFRVPARGVPACHRHPAGDRGRHLRRDRRRPVRADPPLPTLLPRAARLRVGVRTGPTRRPRPAGRGPPMLPVPCPAPAVPGGVGLTLREGRVASRASRRARHASPFPVKPPVSVPSGAIFPPAPDPPPRAPADPLPRKANCAILSPGVRLGGGQAGSPRIVTRYVDVPARGFRTPGGGRRPRAPARPARPAVVPHAAVGPALPRALPMPRPCHPA